MYFINPHMHVCLLLFERGLCVCLNRNETCQDTQAKTKEAVAVQKSVCVCVCVCLCVHSQLTLDSHSTVVWVCVCVCSRLTFESHSPVVWECVWVEEHRCWTV